MEKRKVVEHRFGDAALGEQPESAVEQSLHHALFLKNIRERPVAHYFGEAVALANGVGHPRSHKGGVRHRGLVHVAGVELAPDERSVRVGGSGNLVMNFLDRAADHLRSWNVLVRAEDVFRFIVPVDVRRSKIHWNVFLLAVRQEAVHPGGLRRGRAANAATRAHAFDGAGSAILELVVGGFLRATGPEINIGLVPDFEIPLRDLVDTVALDEMAREILDELFPLGPIFWRRDVLLVPKRMKRVWVGGKLLGHEAEFDKRTNMIL